jgi:hypothetical protein
MQVSLFKQVPIDTQVSRRLPFTRTDRVPSKSDNNVVVLKMSILTIVTI